MKLKSIIYFFINLQYIGIYGIYRYIYITPIKYATTTYARILYGWP